MCALKQTPYLEMRKWSYSVTARQSRGHLYNKTPNSLSRHRMWGAHKAPQIKYKELQDVFLLLMLVLVSDILRFLSASHRWHRWLKRVHRLDDVPLWSKETKSVTKGLSLCWVVKRTQSNLLVEICFSPFTDVHSTQFTDDLPIYIYSPVLHVMVYWQQRIAIS